MLTSAGIDRLGARFGLGGREIAGEQVQELLASFKSKRDQPPRP
ncbi:hypothetical protein [Nostoc sp. 'Lobaria pulmonaria (5183) cyanobiont']|nr:hypothetical protein [Nostoc sp. 'Lobaria pulmonaria (5183) cyanobiont']